MKSVITLLALGLCITSAAAQQSRASIRPAAFTLHGAVTFESIKTIFMQDGIGMYLSSIYDGPNTPDGQYEIGLEVMGYAAGAAPLLNFGIARTAYSGDFVEERIEVYNYTSQNWDLMVWPIDDLSLSATNARPYFAPFTYVQVPFKEYVDLTTGAVRARVVWKSPKPFQAVWIDFAGWQLAWD